VRYRIKLHGDLTVFKMTAIRHLGFLKLEFLTVGTIERVNVRHCAKFRDNQSNHS